MSTEGASKGTSLLAWGRITARGFSKRKLAIEAIGGVPVLYKTGSLVLTLVELLQVIAVNGGS